MTQALNNLEPGLSNMAHLLELGLLMSTMTPSNTIPPHTLTRHATTVTLNPLMHSLIETTIPVNSMTESQKNVASLTLTFSSLQIYAAHAMVERLCLREMLAKTVKTGMKPLQDMLQNARRDSSVYMKNKLMLSPSQEWVISAQNLKVFGPLKINKGTGTIVVILTMSMMATGSAKMKSNPECGTTLQDPTLKDSGKMTGEVQMALGLQIVLINLSELA